MELTMRYCPECREDQLFERPHETGQCPDAGDEAPGECPELACTECGLALVIAFIPRGASGGPAVRAAGDPAATAPAARPLPAERRRRPERAA